MSGSSEQIKPTLYEYVTNRCHELYGENPPEEVSLRLEEEWLTLSRNGYKPIFDAAWELVLDCRREGFPVEAVSTGASSFVAFLAGISDANPLKTHYHCPNSKCRHSLFYNAASVGNDLPGMRCPKCGSWMIGTGYCLPMEMIWGYHRDRTPFFCFNLAEEYFDRLDLIDQDGLCFLKAEPEIQVISSKSLSLLKKLEELTGVSSENIPADDEKTIVNFRPDGLGRDEAIVTSMKRVLSYVKPYILVDLIMIEGLSYSSGLWEENEEALFCSGTPLSKLVTCREDVFLNLIDHGLSTESAFRIMDTARKGRLAKSLFYDKWKEEMQNHDVPEWYIDVLCKTQYLYTRAACVPLAITDYRITWFRINYPEAYEKLANTLH